MARSSRGNVELSAAPPNDAGDPSSTPFPKDGLRRLSKAERKRIRRFYALAFARVLKELRSQFGLTPAQAATRAKMTRAKWVRRENGLVSPRMDEVVKLAICFGREHLWIFERLIEYRDEEQKKAEQRSRKRRRS